MIIHMKKFFLILASAILGINAYAFEFDGINLNDDAVKVTRAISSKNYVHDPAKNCLKGNCHGTEIYLSFNFEDVSTKGKVGQLIVEVPMKNEDAIESCTGLLNVIYHQVEANANGVVYSVGTDGTTMLLQKAQGGIKLVYSTPYYKTK